MLAASYNAACQINFSLINFLRGREYLLQQVNQFANRPIGTILDLVPLKRTQVLVDRF
jgi:hypothetical protein